MPVSAASHAAVGTTGVIVLFVAIVAGFVEDVLGLDVRPADTITAASSHAGV